MTPNGTSLTQLRIDTLRIGRGTSAELRSENPAVALVHAAIEAHDEGYRITDWGSITGTYVNGRPVESERLSKGDVIDIGDLRLEVQFADPGKPLFLGVTTTAPIAATDVEQADEEAAIPHEGGEMRSARIDYVLSFRLKRPYLTRVSLTAIITIITLVVIGSLTEPQKQAPFMPGNLSSAHGRARDAEGQSIGTRCEVCHTPWQGVTDTSCTACHMKFPHATTERDAPACADCHAEHRGAPRLAAIADRRCQECHRDLDQHVIAGARAPIAPHISGFGQDHPNFAPRSDRDTLRFNHALHLDVRGLPDDRGSRKVLKCTDCHALVDSNGKADPTPIRFTTACQSCHRLTFDSRFPTAEVPHGGDAGLAYGYVLATYSGNRELLAKPPSVVRRILASRPVQAADQRAVLAAEQVLRTKCALCHDLVRRANRLEAVPPVILTQWLVHARFSHTPHRNLDCESCHDRARESEATSDVLIARRSRCMACHTDDVAAAASKDDAAGSCVKCHLYHEHSKSLLGKPAPAFVARLGVQRGVKGDPPTDMLHNVLLIVIALLVLVVFLPVAIAAVRRLATRRDDERPPRNRSLPPTQRVAAIKAPDRSDSGTDKKAKPAASAAPESNPMLTMELALWQGALRCTAGSLAGQVFVIEENGFYIGRDPQLSQVVIDDGRISKRHVRIVPRGQKIYAIDQESTNGTFLASAPEQRITEVVLKPGDEIVLAGDAARFLYSI